MDRTYLQWNFVNWLTVFLMVMVGYAVISAGAALWTTKVKGA